MPTITIEIPERLMKEKDREKVEKEVTTLLRWIALQILSEELQLTKNEADKLEEKIREDLRGWVTKKVR